MDYHIASHSTRGNKYGNEYSFLNDGWTTLLPPAATSQELGNPDEDVNSIHVDAHARINGVVQRGSVAHRVSLSPVDDLLSVVQEKGAEEKKTPVHGHRVETSSH